MAESFIEKLRRQAIRLVFERKLTPLQAAKKLQCSSRAVRRWVQDHREAEKLAAAEPFFISVDIAETDEVVEFGDTAETRDATQGLSCGQIPVPEKTILVEILIRNGLMLRLQLSSINEVAELLQTLEADRC